MRSRTVHLPEGPCPRELLIEAARDGGGPPDFALAFLPPDERLEPTLATLASAWPESLRFGCEAVTQFADEEMTSHGSLQLFWFDHPGHRVEVEVVHATPEEPPAPERLDALAARLRGADGALLLVDGLRFPAERFLGELRVRLAGSDGAAPRVAGGLASQLEPVSRLGARVFLGQEVYPSTCLVVLLEGVEMRVEVVRGWSPASPIYSVTRAEGNVIFEIDGEPATEWYRRFFTVGGRLAPMPESAYRFPLIVEGPAPERQGLYRSMRFFDQPPGAVTYWGSVQEGDQVRLGMGNDVSLVRTAAELPAGRRPDAAVLYSCVGREVVLGDLAHREAATIHQALDGTALSGFFTFAEIGPTPAGGLAYYNQTAILVLLTEVAP
jgi:hypothetical protein